MPTERLQKFLANSGVASRRKSEELISQGQVRVNGSIITKLGTKIDPNQDKIEVNGQKIISNPEFVYYALNKPKGHTTTASDPHAKHNVLELVPPVPRVFPVGRLDKDTTGLLLLTNDGDLAYHLTHPKFIHEKEYLVKVRFQDKSLSNPDNLKQSLHKLEKGIKLEEGITAPAKITNLQMLDNQTVSYHITIHEGRKRQIRRMNERIGLKVIELTRLRIAKLNLNNIPVGHYRQVAKEEIV